MATTAFGNTFTEPPGSYSYTSVDLALDDAGSDVDDGANDHTFVSSGRELLIVENSTGSPIVLTITSVSSKKTARSASSAQQDYSIPANETHMIGPFLRDGWADSANLIKMQAAAVGLRAAVVTLPQTSFQ